MNKAIKDELESCESLTEIFVVLSRRYDLSAPLSYTKKIMILAGLKKAIALINPKER